MKSVDIVQIKLVFQLHKLSMTKDFYFSQIIVFLALVINSYQIVQQCQVGSKKQECPSNSKCNQNGYCQCKPGYLFDCQTKGTVLNQTKQSVELALNSQKLFIIYPTNDSTIYFYRFNFCRKQKASQGTFKLNLYLDNGDKNQLDKSSSVGQADLVYNKQCWSIFSPFLKFNKQTNGAIQDLILTVNITDQRLLNSISQKISGDKKKYKISMSVDQIALFDLETLWIILFSMLGIMLIGLVSSIVYCIWWARTRGSRKIKKNNLDHFQKYMPKIRISKKSSLLQLQGESTCPICLFEFASKDYIRITLCSHYFHQACLDEWCKQNLSCPVCRQILSQEVLKNYFTQNKSKISEKQTLSDEQREQDSVKSSILSEYNQQQNKRQIKKKLID